MQPWRPEGRQHRAGGAEGVSSDIPLARAILRDQIACLRAATSPTKTGPEVVQAITDAIKIAEVALSYMTRESVKPRRARAKSDTLDATLAMRIRAYIKANPAVSTKDAANLFNVNQGRITEALQHKV